MLQLVRYELVGGEFQKMPLRRVEPLAKFQYFIRGWLLPGDSHSPQASAWG